MVPRLDVGWIDSLPETLFFQQSSHAFIRDIYTNSKGDNRIKAFNQTLPWILSPAHIIFTFLTKTNKINHTIDMLHSVPSWRLWEKVFVQLACSFPKTKKKTEKQRLINLVKCVCSVLSVQPDLHRQKRVSDQFSVARLVHCWGGFMLNFASCCTDDLLQFEEIQTSWGNLWV